MRARSFSRNSQNSEKQRRICQLCRLLLFWIRRIYTVDGLSANADVIEADNELVELFMVSGVNPRVLPGILAEFALRQVDWSVGVSRGSLSPPFDSIVYQFRVLSFASQDRKYQEPMQEEQKSAKLRLDCLLTGESEYSNG